MYLSNFKAFLKNDLADRCDDNLNKLVLTKASFFDKRFAMLKFLEAEASVEKETVMQEIICELLVIEKKLKDEEKVLVDEASETPAKKKRFLGYGLSDHDDEERNGNKFDALAEMEKYEKESKLKSDEDPFLWWRLRKELYPCMSKLARKF